MKVLILEDEQHAGEKLKDLISKHCKNVTKIDWLRSITEGVTYLSTSKGPDLIFSDIELIDGKSFEIYNQVSVTCPIIFCTAYNQFFMEAFKTTGIGYLLKPYTEEEFVGALEKYYSLFNEQKQEVPVLDSRVIAQWQDFVDKASRNYKKTFAVKKGTQVYLLPIKDIFYFQAQGDFVFAFDTSGNRHILNFTLSGILEQVNQETFHQINRSEIINFNGISKFHTYTKNRLEIFLKDGKTTLYTSNSRTPDFRNWLEQR
ncbi:MAG: LytTR family DNA-binding domain-containing protein [Bacteroidota bacterium]